MMASSFLRIVQHTQESDAFSVFRTTCSVSYWLTRSGRKSRALLTWICNIIDDFLGRGETGDPCQVLERDSSSACMIVELIINSALLMCAAFDTRVLETESLHSQKVVRTVLPVCFSFITV